MLKSTSKYDKLLSLSLRFLLFCYLCGQTQLRLYLPGLCVECGPEGGRDGHLVVACRDVVDGRASSQKRPGSSYQVARIVYVESARRAGLVC